MDLDDLLYRYFGTRDLELVPSGAIEAGIERLRVDFGMARERGQRFSLWSVLHMLGSAPDLDVTFKDEADREAARTFMDFVAAQS